MNDRSLRLLLADDDKDDRVLFQDALDELSMHVKLETVNDGEELMQVLNITGQALPDLLFLDLNMPRKNGFECLLEIKRTEKLKGLPIIIFSTSFDQEIVDMLYKKGARHYLRKPNEFEKLKTAILAAVTSVKDQATMAIAAANFVL